MEQVVQRGLPRPEVLTMLPEPQPSLEGKPPEEVAETLLQAEMLALIRHEAEKYPVKARKKDKKRRREEVPAGANNAWEEFEVSFCLFCQSEDRGKFDMQSNSSTKKLGSEACK